ncbi:hypothetical protein O181_012383 [Austropuccinia psidii MF-1]|uniref:Uncharacterized protein n=1 Tax=Austropuccinia psidii MF-1 TaxID=1389203 RepID=A0A9Q3BWQ1_9BASI|nr:hypothetical protein [Austropuccinia psidii MF-1]
MGAYGKPFPLPKYGALAPLMVFSGLLTTPTIPGNPAEIGTGGSSQISRGLWPLQPATGLLAYPLLLGGFGTFRPPVDCESQSVAHRPWSHLDPLWPKFNEAKGGPNDPKP